MLLIEKEQLVPLPAEDFDLAEISFPRVDQAGCAKVRTNFYALCNAATETRVKAVASISTFNLGEARREGMGTISYEERMKRLKEACQARSREAHGEVRA